jgi:hypothetical protein
LCSAGARPLARIPDDKSPPTQGSQRLECFLIALSVPFQLGKPVVGTRRGSLRQATAFVLVPEAPMNKDCLALPAHDDVGGARKVLSVEPISNTIGRREKASHFARGRYRPCGCCASSANAPRARLESVIARHSLHGPSCSGRRPS